MCVVCQSLTSVHFYLHYERCPYLYERLKMTQNLKYLTLTGELWSILPCSFSHLVQLNLKNCPFIKTLPLGFKSLCYLEISGCESFCEFPTDLVVLRKLEIFENTSISIIPSFPECIELVIQNSTTIISIAALPKLSVLTVFKCPALIGVSSSLTSLTSVVLSETGLTSLPDTWINLKELCCVKHALVTFPNTYSNLSRLTCSESTTLLTVPNEIGLNLNHFSCYDCPNLRSVPQVMPKLDFFRCENALLLTHIPENALASSWMWRMTNCPWLRYPKNTTLDERIQKVVKIQRWYKINRMGRGLLTWMKTETFCKWFWAADGIGGCKHKLNLENSFLKSMILKLVKATPIVKADKNNNNPPHQSTETVILDFNMTDIAAPQASNPCSSSVPNETVTTAVTTACRGKVSLARIGFFKKLQSKAGYTNVFPNHRHANRTDGIGMASLSPMKVGPVKHGQPDLPDAILLENFWQQSKWFPHETEEEFKIRRLKGFQDRTPHRHVFKRGMKPKGWVWNDGRTTHVLGWIESRQFYCNLYERLIKNNPEFLRLEAMVASGTNVQICGFDAVPIPDDQSELAYLSDKAPYAHERVLWEMLTQQNQEKWTWRMNKTFDF